MKQAIAFWLIILFAAVADGMMNALGPVGFLAVGAVIMAAAYILIRWGEVDEAQPD